MSADRLDLLLIRHGLTDWNEARRLMGRMDIGLNARGQAQAAALASALRTSAIDTILCSPQRRAQETAQALAQACGAAITTHPGLDEVWLTRWQGHTWAELQGDPDLEKYLADPTFPTDAVEPIADVQQRILAVVDMLRQERGTGTVALVSHGDPLRSLVAHTLSIELARFRCMAIDNGSVSVVRDGRNASRLLLLNWRPELGSLLS